ncbi:MAG: methyltransferase family protein [Candidatus Acidiferrales bacterium]
MRTLFDAVRALIYSAGIIWLWGWIAASVRQYDSRFSVTIPAWLAPLGIVITVAGGVLAFLCISTFVLRGHGTPAPFDAPRQFVIVGPYRYVRNPMYVGAFAVILGISVYLRSISILLLSVAFCVVAGIFVHLYEEPHLQEAFGATYDRYCQSVPRWIPRIIPAGRRM